MNTKRLLSIVTMLIITASLLLAAGAPAKQNNQASGKIVGRLECRYLDVFLCQRWHHPRSSY